MQINGFTNSPPIANGMYQLDPNNHFLVYCTFDGYVYATKIGDPTIRFLENITQEMPIFRQNDNELSLGMTFLPGETQYWVTITDQTSGQSNMVRNSSSNMEVKCALSTRIA